jgi:pseudouridine synthase
MMGFDQVLQVLDHVRERLDPAGQGGVGPLERGIQGLDDIGSCLDDRIGFLLADRRKVDIVVPLVARGEADIHTVIADTLKVTDRVQDLRDLQVGVACQAPFIDTDDVGGKDALAAVDEVFVFLQAFVFLILVFVDQPGCDMVVLDDLLTHPAHHVPKVYRVSVKGKVDDSALSKLGSALVIDGRPITPVEVTVVDRKPAGARLEMTLYEGRNRQIRKMCEACGLEVSRLKRIRIGDISVNGIAPGTYRVLGDAEVAALRRAAKKGTEEEDGDA